MICRKITDFSIHTTQVARTQAPSFKRVSAAEHFAMKLDHAVIRDSNEKEIEILEGIRDMMEEPDFSQMTLGKAAKELTLRITVKALDQWNSTCRL